MLKPYKRKTKDYLVLVDTRKNKPIVDNKGMISIPLGHQLKKIREDEFDKRFEKYDGNLTVQFIKERINSIGYCFYYFHQPKEYLDAVW
jgi:hypothetical protein